MSDSKAHDRARWSEWLLGVGALLSIAALWSSWQQLQLIQDLARGAYVANAVVEASDARQQLIGFAQLGLGLVSAGREELERVRRAGGQQVGHGNRLGSGGSGHPRRLRSGR